jgi:hypothetical protein
VKAFILFSGSAPLLLLTSYESARDPQFINKLATRGIKKFVAYEVPEDLVKQIYAKHYECVMEDLHQSDDLRVLDYDGYHVVNTFSFKTLGKPVLYEP